ncbi:MAG: hypothetical protein ABID84_05865 [Chloroflexota bacterium]
MASNNEQGIQRFYSELDALDLGSELRVERVLTPGVSNARLRKITERLAGALGDTSTTTIRRGGFTFFPNTRLAAGRPECPEITCRLERLDKLARFASLYSDCVYLPDYFQDHPDRADLVDPVSWRYDVYADLVIMNRYRELFEAGLFQLWSPEEHVCDNCLARWVDETGTLAVEIEQYVNRMRGKLNRKGTVQFVHQRDWYPDHEYAFLYKGFRDLLPHGSMLLSLSDPPKALSRQLSIQMASSGPEALHLTRASISRRRLLDNPLELVAHDAILQYLAAQVFGSGYLTDRSIDADLLDTINQRTDFRWHNEVVQSKVVYEMPFILKGSLQDLLRLRQDEADAFITYRSALNEAIKSYLAEHDNLSENLAQQIYLDIVQPKGAALAQRVKSTQEGLRKTSKRKTLMAFGVFGIGLASVLGIGGLAPMLGTIGGAALAQAAILDHLKARDIPKDVLQDSFYFLWKATRVVRE